MRSICCLTVILISLTEPQSVVAQQWNQFGGPDRNFILDQTPFDPSELSVGLQWQSTVGPGKSSVVVSGNSAFVAFRREIPNAEAKEKYQEGIQALDLSDGKVQWEQVYESSDLSKQESFSGDPRAPQATPVIVGEYIVSIGFTGQLSCLRRNDGELTWKKDLVSDANIVATPVQFGFSASPICKDDKLYVFVGGKNKSLIAMNVSDGTELWSIECGEATYSTPTFSKLDAVDQILLFTRDEVVGVSESAGEILWRIKLPQQGLTNVPMLLPIAEDNILVSGQGVGGTMSINVDKQEGGGWQIDENWKVRSPQMFYTNWIPSPDGKFVLGCTENLLVAFDAATGKRAGRWRGFGDGNLLRLQDQLLCINGRGSLSLLRFTADGLMHEFKQSLIKKRVWAMPTLVGSQLLVRAEDKIYCFGIEQDGPTTNELSESKLLEFRQ